MKILFVDSTCPKPYNVDSLQSSTGIGGTEITVAILAKELARQGHHVWVYQANRDTFETDHGVKFAPFDGCIEYSYPDVVIVLRNPMVLPLMHQTYPDAKLIFWVHDLADYLAPHADVINTVAPTIVGVSQFHKTDIIDTLKATTGAPINSTITHIYNPIIPVKPTVKETRLVWASSPHKGLAYGLAVFKHLRRKVDLGLQLHVMNPGYFESSKDSMGEGVTILEPMPYNKSVQYIANSRMLFYPNTEYRARETFGRVVAEAQSAGVPALYHAMGAANEVGCDSNPPIDCRDLTKVENTVRAILDGVVTASGNNKMSLDAVINDWTHLFIKDKS